MLVDLAVNLFCHDHERVFGFYRDLLEAPEMSEHASPIYRGLKLPGVSLGFHAQEAYTLLDLVDYSTGQPSTGHYPTFNVDSVETVDALTRRAIELGATVRKGPYTTYYNAYQVVLLDPEGNVFRLNHYLPAAPA
jgi:catechol 2,3-dioxygenase-like lactoylglutathione lyase family enzyme